MSRTVLSLSLKVYKHIYGELDICVVQEIRYRLTSEPCSSKSAASLRLTSSKRFTSSQGSAIISKSTVSLRFTSSNRSALFKSRDEIEIRLKHEIRVVFEIKCELEIHNTLALRFKVKSFYYELV